MHCKPPQPPEDTGPSVGGSAPKSPSGGLGRRVRVRPFPTGVGEARRRKWGGCRLAHPFFSFCKYGVSGHTQDSDSTKVRIAKFVLGGERWEQNLLPFCYRFWHNFQRLETKVGEITLKSPSLKWKEKQGLLQFCWIFASGFAESRYRSQIIIRYYLYISS